MNLNKILRHDAIKYVALFVVPSIVYGGLIIKTGKVNPLEQLNVKSANVELRKEEADRRYNDIVYALFRNECGALADLNKDCKVSLEELTEAFKIMGVTGDNLRRAVIDYLDGKVGKMIEIKERK